MVTPASAMNGHPPKLIPISKDEYQKLLRASEELNQLKSAAATAISSTTTTANNGARKKRNNPYHRNLARTRNDQAPFIRFVHTAPIALLHELWDACLGVGGGDIIIGYRPSLADLDMRFEAYLTRARKAVHPQLQLFAICQILLRAMRAGDWKEDALLDLSTAVP